MDSISKLRHPGMAEAIRQVERLGRPVALPRRVDACFDSEGRRFERRGPVIVIDGKGWHVGLGMAREMFRRLSSAAV